MKIKCNHCHLEYDENLMIEDEFEGERKYFCCKGCQGVYHLLKSEHLDSFYDKLGSNAIEPPKNEYDSSLKFDLDSFKKKYIRERDGLNEISLIIEGIHCSACVWLNEKVLRKKDGVIEADINYTNSKAKILFDPETINLSEIIEAIRSIGYNAYPYDPQIQEDSANRQRKDFYIRLAFGIFATMNIMWIAIAQYAGYFTGIKQDVKDILNIAEFILATPTLFFTGWVFFKGAYYGLRNRFINMDLLVSVGATLTYLYSIYAMITRVGDTYFDSVTMIITFVLIGKFLETLSKKKAVDTLDTINSSLPTEVLIIKGDEKVLVTLEEVQVGDIIEVRAGDKVVIDGVIINGEGSFDESSLTGESNPIYKEVGESVLSGSINLDSLIRYRATKDFNHSTLSTIISLLEDSLNKKPNIEVLANNLSKYFSIAILTIATLTFLGWFFLAKATFEYAFIVTVSVIIIACPCALALATPVATLIGISVANRRGVLFKEAKFIETMAKANILAIDKTGTITEGKPKVTNYQKYEAFNPNILFTLVSSSKHPISRGIKEYLEEDFGVLEEVSLSEVKTIQAKGIKANYKGLEVLGGNREFLRECGVNLENLKLKDEYSTLFLFAVNGNLIASFELFDKIKKDAKEIIKTIQSGGVEVVMLTGDNQNMASRVAKEVGIDKFYANLLPQDKLKYIDEYHDRGKIVVMAGDGINDSLALSKSDIAISMQSGADVAIDVSDVILLNNSLSSLRDAFAISKRTYKFIKQNLAISLIYNSITVPLAVAGFIIPLVAAISMSLSSLIVVGNSMRIKKGF